jgi:hypothetical protein
MKNTLSIYINLYKGDIMKITIFDIFMGLLFAIISVVMTVEILNVTIMPALNDLVVLTLSMI